MCRNFEDWFKTLRTSINICNDYIDFHKVIENAGRLKIEISILSSLIGSQNIEHDFQELIDKYPECLKAIPILLAVRECEIYCQDERGAITFHFDRKVQTAEQYTYFMRQTGLFELLSSKAVPDLQSYVTGVEAGMNSNGRKNRGGLQMEKLVEHFLQTAGVEYYTQMYLEDIEKRWHIDLSPISSGGTSTKKFDFVVKAAHKVYAIETNFYTSGGSKLNETARSYKLLSEEAKHIDGFVFIWITDGGGWTGAKNNLEDAFNAIEHIYNIADIEGGLFGSLFI